MHNFNFSDINDYITAELATAPEGLKNGWWGAYPDLLFYDLQKALEYGVFSTIAISLVATILMMLLTSLNFLITFYAGFTILFVISATLGTLALCGWVLNVIESVTLSLAVGLSIDFTIHYGVAYKLSKAHTSQERMKESLSKVGSSVFMASLTTFLAGAAIAASRVLPYQELGQFLMLVMVFSWSFSTFFYQALLHWIGPTGGFCQISIRRCNFVQKVLTFCSFCKPQKLSVRSDQAGILQDTDSECEDDDNDLISDYLHGFSEGGEDVPLIRA